MALAEARAWLAARTPSRPPDTVRRQDAAGRVLAADLPLALWPLRATAAIDGAAVRAAGTEGASDYAPLGLGGDPVNAGDLVPDAADAVVPLAAWDNGAALVPVARGHGIIPPGRDIPRDAIIPAGTCLTPFHIALAPTNPSVRALPRVCLRIAGPKHGADVLTPLLHALVIREGAVLTEREPDLILVAGRSGPGADDDGPAAFTGMHAHGVAIRPGETCAIGLVGIVPAILLPGNPADCATVFALLAAPTLRRFAGRSEPRPLQATLTRKITSILGQIDAIRVRLDGGQATPLGPAEGIGMLAAAGADGLVLVPEGSEGYPAGASVPIHPL